MTTSKQVLELLSNPGGTGRGAALWVRMAARKPSSDIGPGLRALADEIWSREAPTSKSVTHPRALATKNRYLRESDEELTGAELAWLQRLPMKPSEVSFDDACQLAALASSISRSKAPASGRLVRSIWGPVEAFHDKRVAEARVENAKVPMSGVPNAAYSALCEAITAENPDLGEAAVGAEASERLVKWAERAQADHESALARAQSDLDEVDARIARFSDSSDNSGEAA